MGFYLRDNPCRKECPDRKPGCHTKECPYGWYEWHEAYTNFKKEEAKERQVSNHIRNIHSNKKRKRSDESSSLRNKSLLYRIAHDNKIGD